MRYILFLFLVATLSFTAEVNEALYSENNATNEIQKVRAIISSNQSTDPEIQNKISIQKLFLSKIETLATTPPEQPIGLYELPNKLLTQKEFLAYFDHLAESLNERKLYEKNKVLLSERLISIKEHLSSLRPEEKSEIIQTQLQYAYFKWKSIYNDRRFKRSDEYLQREKDRFISSFKNTDVDIESLDKQANKLNTKLQLLYQKKDYLELSLEKEVILLASKKVKDITPDLNNTKLINNLQDEDKNWKYNFIRKELDNINLRIANVLKEKINALVLYQIKNLQEEDIENFVVVRGIMQSFSHDLPANDREMFDLEQAMLEWLKYEHIGQATAIFYDFKTWIDNIYTKTIVLIEAPLFYLNDKPVRISDILVMFLTIIFGFMLAKFYKRRVIAAQHRIGFIQKQSFKIIGNLGYYFIVFITIAISLNNIGLDLTSLSLVAGALSVGIGFGLKEMVGNFVSGIILMAERSVRIGDFVEIENEVSGNVTDIRMRSVTIRTSSNIDIIVPNSYLVQQMFTNYTLEESVRRLSIPFTVAYGVSFEKVNEVILDALDKSELNYIRDSKEYETEVIMTGMDERGVNYTLFVFVQTYGPNARSSFFRLIYKTLQEQNIPIPAPKIDVKMISKEDI